jgi:hypothetical protein
VHIGAATARARLTFCAFHKVPHGFSAFYARRRVTVTIRHLPTATSSKGTGPAALLMPQQHRSFWCYRKNNNPFRKENRQTGALLLCVSQKSKMAVRPKVNEIWFRNGNRAAAAVSRYTCFGASVGGDSDLLTSVVRYGSEENAKHGRGRRSLPVARSRPPAVG